MAKYTERQIRLLLDALGFAYRDGVRTPGAFMSSLISERDRYYDRARGFEQRAELPTATRIQKKHFPLQAARLRRIGAEYTTLITLIEKNRREAKKSAETPKVS